MDRNPTIIRWGSAWRWPPFVSRACRTCLLVDAATFVMAGMSSAAVDSLADPTGALSFPRIAIGLLWVAIAIAIRLLVARAYCQSPPLLGKHAEDQNDASLLRHCDAPPLSIWWVAMLAAITISPLAVEPLLRRLLEEGRPLEILLLLGLRNLGVGLAALSLWPGCARLSAAASMCVMLFAHVIDENSSAWLLALFAIAGAVWLIVSYQARFSMLAAASAESPRVVRSRRTFPWRVLLWASGILFLPLVIWLARPSAPLLSLGEWIHSSGGTGAEDPYARGGVNDGQNELGGENPETAGFAETDKFLDSNDPTLYDAASDLYGEPARKRKNQQERMISVAPSDVREIKNHAQNHRAGREFAAARKSPERPQKRPEDRAARALFEVKGRTPLHLRMDVLARYDGAAWQALQIEPCPDLIEPALGKGQMKIKLRNFAREFGPAERHQLKIASLKGSLAPTPSLLSTFRVGLIDRHDFFEWRRDGVLGFRGRETIPSGTTIETHCQTVNLVSLTRADLATSATAVYLELAGVEQERYAAIAKKWSDHLPQGPAQIAAIIERLRTTYQHDRTATVETSEGDPVLQFLETRRSGPDYLFASAAVLLFRSRGYPARLCFGYYAAPQAYDPWTRHTPVREDDLHFWPEVMLANGDWHALEPTPGYETLLPAPTLAQRLTAAVVAIGKLAAKRPLTTLLTTIVLLAAAYYRREVADFCRVFRLRLFPGRDCRARVFGALEIIERRAALYRQSRSEHQTLAQWASRFPRDTAAGQVMHEFLKTAQSAAYNPAGPDDQAEEICREAEQTWSIARFRRLARREKGVRWPSFVILALTSWRTTP